ncbi:hypothetical protein J6590_097841 [Homalodisca vitripennis]|nr:hypothetical protein J6590_097841 [Homalodisca vitripennis]
MRSLHSTLAFFRQIRATTYGLDTTVPQTKVYKRKLPKFDKMFDFGSILRTFPVGHIAKGTCVPNFKFPALLELITGSEAKGTNPPHRARHARGQHVLDERS